jgi:hypothetical protein
VQKRKVILEGTIQRYFSDVKIGVIRGEDNATYAFASTDWRTADREPEPGARVSFEPIDERAVRIILLSDPE